MKGVEGPLGVNTVEGTVSLLLVSGRALALPFELQSLLWDGRACVVHCNNDHAYFTHEAALPVIVGNDDRYLSSGLASRDIATVADATVADATVGDAATGQGESADVTVLANAVFKSITRLNKAGIITSVNTVETTSPPKITLPMPR